MIQIKIKSNTTSVVFAVAFLSVAFIYAIIMVYHIFKQNRRRNQERDSSDSNFESISEYTDTELYETDETQSSVSYYENAELGRSKDTMSD